MERSTLKQDALAYIRDHHSRGNTHIKVKHIASAVDAPPQRIRRVSNLYMSDKMLDLIKTRWQLGISGVPILCSGASIR